MFISNSNTKYIYIQKKINDFSDQLHLNIKNKILRVELILDM